MWPHGWQQHNCNSYCNKSATTASGLAHIRPETYPMDRTQTQLPTFSNPFHWRQSVSTPSAIILYTSQSHTYLVISGPPSRSTSPTRRAHHTFWGSAPSSPVVGRTTSGALEPNRVCPQHSRGRLWSVQPSAVVFSRARATADVHRVLLVGDLICRSISTAAG